MLALIVEPVTAIEGQALSNVLIANFGPNDVSGTSAASYSATVNWGDGSAFSNGTVVADGSGYDVLASHTYLEPTSPGATEKTSVTVNGATGTSSPPPFASQSGTATVNSAALSSVGVNFSATKGVNFSGSVATFQVTNPSAPVGEFTASIDWGDSTKTLGVISSTGPGTFVVQGSHAYAGGGILPTTITITNVGGLSTICSGTASVLSPSPFGDSGQLVVTPIDTLLTASNDLVGVFSYSGTKSSFTSSLPFSASINWGNGNVSPGVIAAIPGTTPQDYGITGMNVYNSPGKYPVSVTLADQSGHTASIASQAVATGSFLVAFGNQIGVTPGVPFNGAVATFVDPNPAASTTKPVAEISWGDGHQSQGTVTGPDANGVYTVTGMNTYQAVGPGSYKVDVSIADPVGTPPVVATSTALVASSLVVTGTTFAVSPESPFAGTVATFTDPLPGAATSRPTAAISWGNGTVSAGMVTGPDANGIFTVTGSIFYLTTSPTGSYPVNVTITDPDGQQAMVTSRALMNAPPPAPMLTGGLDGGGEDGQFAQLGFADTDRPTFSGTSAPFALIQLFAKRIDLDATLPLGQTITGANGEWSLDTGPLADGVYAITAIVTPPSGQPLGPTPLGATGTYVIDTVSPRVVGVTADANDHVYVSFQDDLSGLGAASLMNRDDYTFAGAGSSTFHPVSATILPNPGLPTDVETVELMLGGNAKSKPKSLRITAAGVVDNAGNTLGNDSHGTITRANGRASSNVALKVSSHKPKAPRHR